MAAIEQVVDVSVEGLGAVEELAGAFDKAAESAASLKEELGGLGDIGGASAAGADKFAASWDAAGAKISEIAAGIREDMASLGDIGGVAGGAGLDSLVGKYDAAAAGISGSIGKIRDETASLGDIGGDAAGAATGVGKLGDELDDLAASGAGLAAPADGIKGIGDSASASAAQVAEFNAVMRESAAVQADTAAVSSDASAKIALGQRLNTTAAKDASDDAMAARGAASKQAAADAETAEASATKYHMLALGGAAALAVGVDMAAKLQTSVTRLYTTAGESQKNLPMDAAGILALSGQTNTSQAQLGQGAYMISSAGYHGKDMLGVLKAASEGAQAEGAPLSETGNALTSLMNAYGVPKGQSDSKAAMQDMDEIITMVGQGKMTMATAVSALPAVLPVASAAHISFPQVAGALATMTSMGMSPQWGAQDLRHTIGALQNPNTVQTGEMQQLGLNPVGIAKNLGKEGLTGTFSEINDAVMKSMGPSGLVLMKTFNQSASAASDATTMLKAMPPSLQKVAQGYLDGTVSAKAYNAEVFSGSESAGQKNLLQQFATTANLAHGFNAALKSGQPDAQVYSAAMSKILGGTVGLQTALMLTGQHMPAFKANTDAVAQSAQHAGENVKGWSAVQQTLNFQLGSFVKTSEAVATQAGQIALPAVTGLLHGLGDVTGFLASNPALTKPLLEAGGVLGGAVVASKVVSAGATGLSSIGKVAETLHIPGLDKLAGIGQGASQTAGLDTAATGLSGSATDLAGSAADLSAAAGKLSEGGIGGAGGGAVKTAESDAEGAAEGAGAGAAAKGMDGAGLLGALNPIVAGVLGGELIRGYSDSQAPKGTPAGNISKDIQKSDPMSPDYLFGGLMAKAGLSNAGLDVGKVISGGLSQASQMVTDPFDAIFGTGHKAAAPAPLGKTPADLQGMTDTLGMAMATTKTPKPDLSGITSALASAMGKGVKASPPDVSAYKDAAQKAGADFDSALATALHKPEKVSPPDLSAYSAAKGAATADGVGVSAGFAQGIESGKGTVAAAAASVAAAASSAMKSSLDSRSPSKVTEKIGKDTVTGLVLGLEGGKAAVAAEAADVAKAVTKPWSDGTVADTAKKLIADVESAFRAGDISKGEDSAYTKYLKADTAKLQSLAHQRATDESSIKAADAYASSVQSSALSNASIVNAASAAQNFEANGPAAATAPLMAPDIITQAKDQLRQLQQFRTEIAQDKKLGLNTTELGQIIQSGASTGLPIAQAIASGGKSAVSELNSIQKQTAAAAKALGVTSANAMYESGSQIGQGLAAGLKSDLSSVTSAIDAMASKMVSEIEKELKIHSPSLVFAERGMQVPAGVALGVEDGTGLAVAAIGRMGSRMGSAYHPAFSGGSGHPGGSGGGSGGGNTTVNVTVNVGGSVTTEKDLSRAVADQIRQTGLRNWQTGIVPAGRAS